MAIEEGMLNLESSPYSIFILSIRSQITRGKYLQRIGYFLNFVDIKQGTIDERCNTFGVKAKADRTWLVNNIVKYLQAHKSRAERKEITGSTLRNYIKPIKLFCEQMDITIPWKKVMRGMPKGRRYANDRAPTIDEISRLTQYPDRRIKPILLTMASSGIRLSAWDYLRWKDISPIIKDGKTIAAKIRIYAEDEEGEYFSFITNEALQALNDWMDYRKECGESINENSWIMRNLWDVTTPKGKGVITIPKKLKSTGIKRLMERALWAQGIRRKLDIGKRRHEFQADHGLRKWFKTRCEISGMKSINIEILMGHSIGISDSYYRATEQEILLDYLKAVDYLSILEENKLRVENQKIKESNESLEKEKEELYLLRKELAPLLELKIL
jgi:hypothetical protein